MTLVFLVCKENKKEKCAIFLSFTQIVPLLLPLDEIVVNNDLEDGEITDNDD